MLLSKRRQWLMLLSKQRQWLMLLSKRRQWLMFIGGNMCNMWLYKSNRKCYKYGFVNGWVTCVICGCIKVTGSVINMALLKVVTCVICGCIKVTGSVINMALFIGGNMCNMWLYKSNRKCYKYGFVKGWVTCVICGCIKVTGSVINMALLKVVTCVICGCIKVTGSVINMALLKVE